MGKHPKEKNAWLKMMQNTIAALTIFPMVDTAELANLVFKSIRFRSYLRQLSQLQHLTA